MAYRWILRTFLIYRPQMGAAVIFLITEVHRLEMNTSVIFLIPEVHRLKKSTMVILQNNLAGILLIYRKLRGVLVVVPYFKMRRFTIPSPGLTTFVLHTTLGICVLTGTVNWRRMKLMQVQRQLSFATNFVMTVHLSDSRVSS